MAPATTMNDKKLYVEFYEKSTDQQAEKAALVADVDWSQAALDFSDAIIAVTGFTYTPAAPKVSQTGVSFDINFTSPDTNTHMNVVVVEFPLAVWGSMIQAE